MSTQASAKRALANQLEELDCIPQDGGKTLVDRLQVWKQVALAELLNVLECGRYDLKSVR